MKLSKKERAVLNVLINAQGEPLKVVDICEILKARHGIEMMHNYASKIINERLTNDMRLPIERDYVVINGETKSYKEYKIMPTKPPPKSDNWKMHFNDPCLMYGCGSFYRYGNICNQCGFEFKETVNA